MTERKKPPRARARRRSSASLLDDTGDADVYAEIRTRFIRSLFLLVQRIEREDRWDEVERVQRLMVASADGASTDVQYAALVHLGLHVAENMIACVDPTHGGRDAR